jgi:thioredoxin reductase
MTPAMETLLTFAGFAALTVFFAWWHVRSRTQGRGAPAPAARCPRCRAVVPPGVAACAACGAPLQAFELVTARTAAADSGGSGAAHAIVRADMCVGCGTCVDACPEPGAIRLEDKRAIVDTLRCKGHGLCATACPVGAIVVSAGGAVQVVEVPDVNTDFESNVPGLYVVGELGGRGLIKNAVNEGKLAAEHVAALLPPGAARADGETGAFDLVVVGSGPAGLSAALEAHRRGLHYLVLEQGTLSDTIRKYPRKKLLFAEPVKVPIYGDLWVADGSKEALLRIWEDLIERTGLRILTQQRVTDVVREEGLFTVRVPDGAFRARRVILALGRRGTPRRLEVPGEELDKVFYDIVEMEAFAGQRALVVGGGDSALESALGLANQAGTEVTLSHRGADFGRAKQRNRDKLEAAVAAGRVRLMLSSRVREIRPGVVALDYEDRPHLLPNDVVIVRIGGEAPTPFLERAGVRFVRKELALAAGGGA